MNSRRLSNLLSFIVLGIVALSLLVKYLFITVLHITSPIFDWFHIVSYWLIAFATLISAFSYAQSRRNGIFMILLIVFVAVIIVFNFVL